VTCVNYPAIVEERDSKRDLMSERFNRVVNYVWVIAVHRHKLRPNNFKHQHVMFSVWTVHIEVVQGSEDVIGSGMCPPLRRENAMNLDLVVLAGKLGHDELEGDVSAI